MLAVTLGVPQANNLESGCHLIKLVVALAFFLPLGLSAQNPAQNDPWKPLAFLIGTWDASAKGNAGVASIGTYSFRPELGGHILARHSVAKSSSCKGPADFDCDHGDLLYLYPEGPGLKAIYFDNEGHTIHYDVTTPTPISVQFLSDATTPGPRFRLLYELNNSIMSGKFQMQMPGQTDWHSYLEWSGGKK